jgi:hypothetical protein
LYWWFKYEKFIFSQFWKLKVHDQGVGRLGFSSLSAWLADGCLLATSLLVMVFPLCVPGWYLFLF